MAAELAKLIPGGGGIPPGAGLCANATVLESINNTKIKGFSPATFKYPSNS
jgi:hypothetical protein